MAADAKSYILRSQLPADVYSACVEDKKKSHVTALAFVVTSIVRLAGGKINEGIFGISFVLEHFTIPIYSVSFLISNERNEA